MDLLRVNRAAFRLGIEDASRASRAAAGRAVEHGLPAVPGEELPDPRLRDAAGAERGVAIAAPGEQANFDGACARASTTLDPHHGLVQAEGRSKPEKVFLYMKC
ncbi:MAG: hypothetical protein HYU51_07890 [Candidatus Rokubacteria bacterium]|nr:hypothetical protein [Candidatus Rokubacteria bacterium]